MSAPAVIPPTLLAKRERAILDATPLEERIALLREIIPHRAFRFQRADLQSLLDGLLRQLPQQEQQWDEPEEEPIENEITSVLSELGEEHAEVKINLYRLNPQDKTRAFVAELLPQEFSFRAIAEEYGGGSFLADVYGPQRERPHLRQIYARKRFKIEGSPKVPRHETPVERAHAGGEILPALLEFSKGIQTGFQQLGELIVKSRPSTLETARELAAIKGLFVSDRPSGPDPLGLIEKVIGIVGALRPPADNPSDSAVLLELARSIGPLFQASNKGAPAPLPDAEIPSLPAPEAAHLPAPDPAPQPPAGEKMRALDLVYKGYVLLLVTEADANNAVKPVAEQIYAAAPDEFLDWLFTAPDWMDRLAAYDARVKLYPAWFGRLRDELKKLDAENETGATS